VAAVTVTRTRLAQPPAVEDVPAPVLDHPAVLPAVVRRDPEPLERFKVADATRIMGFLAPWAGRCFTVPELAIATRVPPDRVANVLGPLAEHGWLQQGRPRDGRLTWARIDGQRHG
jgi:hypothetical protein